MALRNILNQPAFPGYRACLAANSCLAVLGLSPCVGAALLPFIDTGISSQRLALVGIYASLYSAYTAIIAWPTTAVIGKLLQKFSRRVGGPISNRRFFYMLTASNLAIGSIPIIFFLVCD